MAVPERGQVTIRLPRLSVKASILIGIGLPRRNVMQNLIHVPALFAMLALAGCASTGTSEPNESQALSPDAWAQFECADRNGNRYIDQTELIYMLQCGIGENLRCGEEPAVVEARPPAEDFQAGLRMIQVTDADADNRISRTEYRAHCNRMKRTDP